MVTCKCQVSQVVFSGTGMDPSQKVDHRDKNLQFQLFSMEHGRRGYPLRNKTMADCEQEAAAKFGNAQVHTPLSVHFTPDKKSQYIVCDGVAAYLPASAAGGILSSHCPKVKFTGGVFQNPLPFGRGVDRPRGLVWHASKTISISGLTRRQQSGPSHRTTRCRCKACMEDQGRRCHHGHQCHPRRPSAMHRRVAFHSPRCLPAHLRPRLHPFQFCLR